MEDFDPQMPMMLPEVAAAKGRMSGARRLIATTLLSVA
jgi:hypothetical protein